MASDTLNIFGLVGDSIVDGPGLRYSIFVQGCPHNCAGCHNPESHEFGAGDIYSIDEIYNDIKSNKLITGITFSGGEPFAQVEACSNLAQKLKKDNYNIWAFSGYLFEDLLKRSRDDKAVHSFLNSIDVLVDGPYVEKLRSIELDFRGSSNQRLIDVPTSLDKGEVVLWSAPVLSYEKPNNW